MTYKLEDEPTAISQWGVRHEPESGCVVVHTAESIMDNVGPDTGAENVANFIAQRTDPGSYHEMGDSDSHVLLVRPEHRSFQVAVDQHNQHAWGWSFATAAHTWMQDSVWDNKALAIAGQRIANYAVNWSGQDLHKAREVAHWIDRGDALLRKPGLVLHGVVQPGTRHDAWVNHPGRATLEGRLRLFVRTEIDRRLAAPSTGEEPMVLVIRPGGALYVVYDGGVMDHGGSINSYAGVGVYQADDDGWNRFVKQNYRAREIANKDLTPANEYSPDWPALIS